MPFGAIRPANEVIEGDVEVIGEGSRHLQAGLLVGIFEIAHSCFGTAYTFAQLLQGKVARNSKLFEASGENNKIHEKTS